MGALLNTLCRGIALVLYMPGVRSITPPLWYIRCQYRFRLNKKLNIRDPKTFNDKIQWMKLNLHEEIYTKMADKYEVRNIVKEKIGEEYLVPLAVNSPIKKVEEIDFESLPEKYVIKCTHDSGSAIIIKDGKKINKEKIKKKLRKCLRRNYYWIGREWAYKNIEPRIIIENYLQDDDSEELRDYKIFCFNGEPKFIQVDFDRHSSHKRHIYSPDWKYMGFTSMYPTYPDVIIPRPDNLEKMMDIARSLSNGLPHVRVDLYNTGSRIYFGELTFYHGSGFEIYDPIEWDLKIGDMLKLPEDK